MRSRFTAPALGALCVGTFLLSACGGGDIRQTGTTHPNSTREHLGQPKVGVRGFGGSPVARIEYGNRVEPMGQGSTCWAGGCVDTVDFQCGGERTPSVKVPANERFTVRFEGPEIRIASATLKLNDGSGTRARLSATGPGSWALTAPSTPSLLILFVRGTKVGGDSYLRRVPSTLSYDARLTRLSQLPGSLNDRGRIKEQPDAVIAGSRSQRDSPSPILPSLPPTLHVALLGYALRPTQHLMSVTIPVRRFHRMSPMISPSAPHRTISLQTRQTRSTPADFYAVRLAGLLLASTVRWPTVSGSPSARQTDNMVPSLGSWSPDSKRAITGWETPTARARSR